MEAEGVERAAVEEEEEEEVVEGAEADAWVGGAATEGVAEEAPDRGRLLANPAAGPLEREAATTTAGTECETAGEG